MAGMESQRAPFPNDQDDFNTDSRINFSRETSSYHLEDELGEEWEWLESVSKWVPVMDEALAERQRSIYKVKGVDETEPAFDPIKKRKAAQEQQAENIKKQKQDQGRKERDNTAIFVSELPLDTDESEIFRVFSKYGMIDESYDTDKPRIKLYHDEEGRFKGEALIVYFRPESVQLAIDMLDESDFRVGSAMPGSMRVRAADRASKTSNDDPSQAGNKKVLSNADRRKMAKKREEMNKRLAWDDDDEASLHPSVAPQNNRNSDKVMVIKGMFTQKELEQDPALYLDIKDDLREQCELYGKVTNVILYDLESEGIMTVRFGDAQAAEACARKMDGRNYEYRTLEAYLSNGREKFKKSSRHKNDSDDEERRLAAFSKDIEAEDQDQSD